MYLTVPANTLPVVLTEIFLNVYSEVQKDIKQERRISHNGAQVKEKP